MQRIEMNQLHLVAAIIFFFILGTNAFSYKDAKNWGKKYPECNGRNQSPIMLEPKSGNGFTEYKKTLRPTNFQKIPKKLTIKNTGHTVEMKADWSGEPPKVTGGPLHGNYVLEKTTFHWAPKRWTNQVYGNPDIKNRVWQEVEMHMFFYRTDLKSFEKAQTQKGGLAVFNTWFWSAFGPSDPSFNNLERNLHKVQSPNSTAEIPPFPFASILDDDVAPFAFYEGSLDYPPCAESVTWFIDNSGRGITKGLINELRKIKLEAGDVSNVRPTQALNKRQVRGVYNHNVQWDLGY